MNDEQLERENERLSALNSILLDTAKSQEKLIKQFRKMLFGGCGLFRRYYMLYDDRFLLVRKPI